MKWPGVNNHIYVFMLIFIKIKLSSRLYLTQKREYRNIEILHWLKKKSDRNCPIIRMFWIGSEKNGIISSLSQRFCTLLALVQVLSCTTTHVIKKPCLHLHNPLPTSMHHTHLRMRMEHLRLSAYLLVPHIIIKYLQIAFNAGVCHYSMN